MNKMAFYFGLISVSANAEAHFDCNNANSLVEKMICNDEELRSLDTAMSQSYNYLASNTDNKSIKTEQSAWLASFRNKCDSQSCIRDVMTERIKELQGKAIDYRHQQWSQGVYLSYEEIIKQLGNSKFGDFASQLRESVRPTTEFERQNIGEMSHYYGMPADMYLYGRAEGGTCQSGILNLYRRTSNDISGEIIKPFSDADAGDFGVSYSLLLISGTYVIARSSHHQYHDIATINNQGLFDTPAQIQSKPAYKLIWGRKQKVCRIVESQGVDDIAVKHGLEYQPEEQALAEKIQRQNDGTVIRFHAYTSVPIKNSEKKLIRFEYYSSAKCGGYEYQLGIFDEKNGLVDINPFDLILQEKNFSAPVISFEGDAYIGLHSDEDNFHLVKVTEEGATPICKFEVKHEYRAWP